VLAGLLDGHVFDAVYSSDLSRASETATILAKLRSLDVRTLESLREKNFGTWEGLTDVDVHERFGDPGPCGWGDAETTDEMAARTVGALLGIGDEHGGETVLVITHGGPMRAALRYCGANDGRIGNCELVRVVVENGTMLRVD
jgi:broad specificity phosphatase PhoE